MYSCITLHVSYPKIYFLIITQVKNLLMEESNVQFVQSWKSTNHTSIWVLRRVCTKIWQCKSMEILCRSVWLPQSSCGKIFPSYLFLTLNINKFCLIMWISHTYWISWLTIGYFAFTVVRHRCCAQSIKFKLLNACMRYCTLNHTSWCWFFLYIFMLVSTRFPTKALTVI